MIGNNNCTNRLIKWMIIAGDFAILWTLRYFFFNITPILNNLNNDKERIFWMLCTFALMVAEYTTPNLIHKRVVGANHILRSSTLLVVTQTLLTYILLRATHFTSRIGESLIYIGIIMLITIIIIRFIQRWLLKKARQLGYNTRTITLVGSDKEIQRLYHKLTGNPTYGYKVLNYFGDIKELPQSGSVSDFESLLHHPDNIKLGNELYICVPRKERDLIAQTSRLCERHMVKFYYVPIAEEALNLHPTFVDDMKLLTTYTSPLEEPLNKIFKRLIDIILSVVFLLPTLILLPFIIIAIKIQSPGPIFFRQLRTGLDGHSFYCYKFRSMHVNKDADRLQATKDDPRKFPFGNFMRKTNIDELPQFWNVLLGNMSIVGPRPHMLAHTDQYKQLINKYMVRHLVKPGVTGWAQVNGFRGETRELWQMEGRVKCDIWYIQHWSIWLDIRIIWMTFKFFFKRDGNAY